MVFRNKKAIVLGGSKGLGAEIIKHLKSLKIKTISCSRKDIDTSDIISVNKFVKKHKNTDILVLNSGGPPNIEFEKLKLRIGRNILSNYFLAFFYYYKI